METSRFFFFGIWGGGVVLTFSIVLWCRWRLYRRHHDRRSFRDLLEGFGLWLVAFSAGLAIGAVLFYPEAATARGLLNSIALGAFLGVGLIMAGDSVESLQKTRPKR